MPKLQIISDPLEFVDKIQIQSEHLYVYLEDIFTPIDNINDEILKVYNIYQPNCMFTDTQMKSPSGITTQYYLENVPKTVIFSPIIVSYFPHKLNIHKNLTYHSFSFLHQIKNFIIPWHIPQIGFRATINKNEFSILSQETQWVLQQETL